MTMILDVIWVDLHPELLTGQRVGAVDCRICRGPGKRSRPYVLPSFLAPERERAAALRTALQTLRNRLDDQQVGSRLLRLRNLADDALADTADDKMTSDAPTTVPEAIWVLLSDEVACYGDGHCPVSTHEYDGRTQYILAADFFLLAVQAGILRDTIETIRNLTDGELREFAEKTLADNDGEDESVDADSGESVLVEDNARLRSMNAEMIDDLQRLRGMIRDFVEGGNAEVDRESAREIMLEMEPTTALILRAQALQRETRVPDSSRSRVPHPRFLHLVTEHHEAP